MYGCGVPVMAIATVIFSAARPMKAESATESQLKSATRAESTIQRTDESAAISRLAIGGEAADPSCRPRQASSIATAIGTTRSTWYDFIGVSLEGGATDSALAAAR